MDDPLVLATGKALVLIATIFQREGLIERQNLGELMEIFGSVAAETQPRQGDIMATWAAMIKDVTPPSGSGHAGPC